MKPVARPGLSAEMRIGLHDSDGTRFPNLALMKLAAWHRARGDISAERSEAETPAHRLCGTETRVPECFSRARGDVVEWWVPMLEYDRVYSSKVFTFTPENPYLPENTVRGGYWVRYPGRDAGGDRRYVSGLQHLSKVQVRHRVSDAGVHTEVPVVRRAEEGRADTAISDVAGGQAA